MVVAGLRFTSWAEVIFVVMMTLPLAFFAACVFSLWRLALCALPLRGRLANFGDGEPSSSPPSLSGNPNAPQATPQTGGEWPFFVLLLPAHNEELVLGAALRSLQSLDYPQERWQAVVIADNCSDRTAEIARENGAVALERFNTTQIGKGYALEWALDVLRGKVAPNPLPAPMPNPDFEAILILDADTLVAPNLLRAFAEAMQAGEKALQARYDVLNPTESWRTKLMTCALALAHVVKPLGRERLKLSDGLKGNGMCFAREVVENVPWSGESITEDIEYTLRLCRARYRVAFLPETTVWAQMPTTGKQSVSQRKRWEGGRYRLLATVVPALLKESLRSRSRILWDRALELIIPPFAEMFAVPLLCLVVSAGAGWFFGWPWAQGLSMAWAVLLVLQAGYLALGLWVARVPRAVALSTLYAPVYIVWKFGVYLVMALTGSAGGWRRTERRQI